MRRFVVYLPSDVGQQLVVRCAVEGIDLSDAMSEAAKRWLGHQ